MCIKIYATAQTRSRILYLLGEGLEAAQGQLGGRVRRLAALPLPPPLQNLASASTLESPVSREPTCEYMSETIVLLGRFVSASASVHTPQWHPGARFGRPRSHGGADPAAPSAQHPSPPASTGISHRQSRCDRSQEAEPEWHFGGARCRGTY